MRFRILLGLALFGATFATVQAQMPRTISYQGVLADAAGTFIPDGSHTLTLKLYDASTGGTLIWTESQAVTLVRGLFNAMLGAATPIPVDLAFDHAYYLGVAVDGGTELTPRTALSAMPYALYASKAGEANALSATATGVVRSVNGGEGAITLVGAGGTTINRSGSTVTISSTGGAGGSGIQGVQSSDGTIIVANANGPVASLSINPSALPTSLPPNGTAGGDLGGSYPNPTVDALQGRAVVATAPTSGQVLKWNGTAWGPAAADGLTLPYTGSINTAATQAFTVTNSSTIGSYTYAIMGRSGNPVFSDVTSAGVVGAADVGYGVYGYSNGVAGVTGKGSNGASGVFGVASQTGDAVLATVSGSGAGVNATVFGSGTGKAGSFAITNSANNAVALEGTTNGSGAGVKGINSSTTGTTYGVMGEARSTDDGTSSTVGVTGVQGLVTPTGAGKHSAGVRGINNSTSLDGVGVLGYQAGEGAGVYGESPSGVGVYGLATATTGEVFGVGGNVVSPAGAGLFGGYAGSGAGTALQIHNGAIKVSGANRPVFVHTVSNTTPSHITTLNYPGMSSTDMLIVTHVSSNGGHLPRVPYSVWWNGTAWTIYLDRGTGGTETLPNGEKFNVMVIKQ